MNLKYYGVRYNKILIKRHPNDDFWNYYKGSSRNPRFDKKTGTFDGIEPDIRRIHKVFSCKKEALMYEQKFLTRVKAKYKDEWLNKSDKEGILITEEFCQKMKNRKITWKIVGWSKGRKHTDATKKILSRQKRGKNNPFYGKKHTNESLEKNRKNNLYYTYDIECPDGKILTVHSLKEFCRINNLIYSNMRQRKYSKGYKILKKIEIRKSEVL